MTDESTVMTATTLSPHKLMTVAGKKLAYLDQGQGFPVLLGHSYLWNSHMWQPQIEALSPHFRVVAPDLWGHGLSGELPSNTHTLQDLAQHYLALLDALEIEECHVVGLSVGGMWGEALAQLAPTRVRKLVLMDTYLGAEPALSQAKYLGLLHLIEQSGTISSALLDAIVPMFFRPGIDLNSSLPTTFRAALAEFSRDQLLHSIVPLGRLIFTREERRPGLSQLNADNTLILVGEHDIPRPPEEAHEMADIIGCRMKTIANAGHISNLENPAAVTQELLDFLS
ncbi:alpha/beta fold hydrolase [Glaciimonas sp. GG7]